MTVTDEVVRFTKDSGNVASVTVDLLKNVPVGSRLILAVNDPVTGTVTGWTVTDSKGNTYTKRDSNQAVPLNYQVAIFDADITTALNNTTPDTITIAATGASPAKWCVLGIFADDIASFDKSGNTSGTGTAMSVNASAAATANNQLEVGVFAWTDATGTVDMTPGAGYVTPLKATASPASSGRSMAIEYQYVTTSGTRNASGTLATSQGWGGVIASYTQKSSLPVAYLFDGTNDVPLGNPQVV